MLGSPNFDTAFGLMCCCSFPRGPCTSLVQLPRSDPDFPPTTASLFLGELPEGFTPDEVVWKRPGDLAADPQLFVSGASSLDVKQGGLGNCWFVAACGDLACNRRLLKAVVPDEAKQEWDPAGIFRFRFWLFG